jgi:flagellar hook-associated protein FlgK
MDVTAIALTGLQGAQQTLETASRRLASPDQPGDLVDLSSEMVALLAAKNQFAANAKVIQTSEEMQRLDLFA